MNSNYGEQFDNILSDSNIAASPKHDMKFGEESQIYMKIKSNIMTDLEEQVDLVLSSLKKNIDKIDKQPPRDHGDALNHISQEGADELSYEGDLDDAAYGVFKNFGERIQKHVVPELVKMTVSEFMGSKLFS